MAELTQKELDMRIKLQDKLKDRQKKNKEQERKIKQALNRLNRKELLPTKSQRKLANKRKFLIGAFFEAHAKANNGMVNVVDSLQHIMDGFLDWDYERALFDLPPLSPAVKPDDKNARQAQSPEDAQRPAPLVKEGDPCPRCGTGTVKLRHGKNGSFFGCSEFSKTGCSWTGDYKEPEQTQN